MNSSKSDSYFEPVSEHSSGGTYRACGATSGPWDLRFQHGGPPSSLSVRVAEKVAASETGRQDLVAVRFSAEFVGPVPVDVVEVSARVVRAARSAVLVETVLSAADRECLHARTWLVRDADTAGIAHPDGPAGHPNPELAGLNADFPYANSIEWLSEFGNIDEPGPGRIWGRPTIPLFVGEELSGLQRAALLGDSASGISAALDWSVWSFLNVDLDIHLARPLLGEWVLLDARTHLGAHGSALCRSTLHDVAGEVGCTAQTLVLALR